jgi:hypothetical protein
MIAETGLPMATPAAGTNRSTDIGFDSQYQYQGDGYRFTIRGTYLHENQQLNASFANGLAANPSNTLNTFRAQAALTYGVDGKIVLTGGYFNTWGSSDTLLYANNRTFSPNSDGFTAEIAYRFFGKNNAPKIWPWFNSRIGIQYTATTSSTAPRPTSTWEPTPATTTRCWFISGPRYRRFAAKARPALR